VKRGQPPKRKRSPRRARAHAGPQAAATAATPLPGVIAGAPRVPRSVRKLAREVFRRNDPAEVATRLLHCKSDATVAKTYALFLEYLYGKPVQQVEASSPDGEKVIYQLVTSVPRPQHDLSAGEGAPQGASGQPREDAYAGD